MEWETDGVEHINSVSGEWQCCWTVTLIDKNHKYRIVPRLKNPDDSELTFYVVNAKTEEYLADFPTEREAKEYVERIVKEE